MVRAVALQSSKTVILLRPRFESCLGHNIITPFLGDYIDMDCDIVEPKWLLEKCTLRIHDHVLTIMRYAKNLRVWVQVRMCTKEKTLCDSLANKYNL